MGQPSRQDDEAKAFLLFVCAKDEARRQARYLECGRRFGSAADDYLTREYIDELRMWGEGDSRAYDVRRMEDLKSELEIRQIDTNTAEVHRHLDVLAAKVEALHRNVSTTMRHLD